MRFLAILVIPALLDAQAATAPAVDTLKYRGFALAAPYAEFLARARSIAVPGPSSVLCNTSRTTAQLMECGVAIRDPADSADLYLAAYVLEGRVAFLSFGDSGTAPLVTAAQQGLVARFGRPQGSRPGMWEWRSARERVRLTWRGRGSARWIYIALWDEDVMDRIANYVHRRTP